MAHLEQHRRSNGSYVVIQAGRNGRGIVGNLPSLAAPQGIAGPYTPPLPRASSMEPKRTTANPLSMYNNLQAIRSSRAEPDSVGVVLPPRPDLANQIARGIFPDTMSATEILAIYQPQQYDKLYWYEHGPGSQEHCEATEALWERKLLEARQNTRVHRVSKGLIDMGMFSPPTASSPGFVDPGWQPGYPNEHFTSLYDDVQRNGIHSPIRLQRDLTRLGDEGRPEILNGLHRIAIMCVEHPNVQIPVRFHGSLLEAHEEEHQERAGQSAERSPN